MNWQSVESTAIKEIAWQDNMLFVRFCNDRIYQYRQVCFSTYLDFLNAQSLGKYLNTKIKPNYSATCLQIA